MTSKRISSNLFSMAKAMITSVVLVLIAVAAWKLNQNYDLTRSVFSFAFVGGTLLAVLYRVINPVGWAMILRGLGFRVSWWHCMRIWLHGESRRWLPGSIWTYASRATSAQEVGVPVAVASASMLVELLVTIAAAVTIGIVGTLIYWQQLSGIVRESIGRWGIASHQVITVLAVLLMLVGSGVFTKLRIVERLESLEERIDGLREVHFATQPFVMSFLFFLAMACLNGMVNQSLLFALETPLTVPLIAMMAATAIAWVIGLLAFFAPGGFLVREAVLAAILLPWLPYDIGFSLAVLSRFTQLIAEVAGMLMVMASSSPRQHGRKIVGGIRENHRYPSAARL